MAKEKIIEGVFGINKPSGRSSAQVLRDCQEQFQPSKLFESTLKATRRQLERDNHNQRQRRRVKNPKVKIGHGGTLDPLATGVLIAGIGSGTKSLQTFLECTKTYDAIVLFGTGTDSYDRVGKVLKKAPTDHITKEKVEEALEQFRGKFMQLPPLFSALKMNGKPLYEYAREGKEIPRDIERRQVTVEHLELLEWMEPGTHNHAPPTEGASPAEINVANKLWKQEKAAPYSDEGEKKAQESFERKKRRLSGDIDELIQERPKSRRKLSPTNEDGDDAVMSGALSTETSPEPVQEVVDDTAANKEPITITQSIEPVEVSSPSSKGPPAARIRMTVTSGFYVRSLCHDLGVAVESVALMAELERTRQGQFELGNNNVLEYHDLMKGEDVWGPKLEAMIDAWEKKEKATKWQEETKQGSESPSARVVPASVHRRSPESASEPVANSEVANGDVVEEQAKDVASPQAKSSFEYTSNPKDQVVL